MINPDAVVDLSYDGSTIKLTKVNDTSTSSNLYAPTYAGTAGQILLSSGEGQAPYWANTSAIWARGMVDETWANTAYVSRATTASIALTQDSKLCWAIERTARNDNSLTAHFYNENGGWVAQSKLLSELNYSNYALPLTGGRVTGDIARLDDRIDVTLSNNGVADGEIYPTTYAVLDKNTKIVSRLETIINNTGTTKGFWYVRNYDSSGTVKTQKGIHISVTKDNVFKCNIDGNTAVAGTITATGGTINGDLIVTKNIDLGSKDSTTYTEFRQYRKSNVDSTYGGLLTCLEANVSKAYIYFNNNGNLGTNLQFYNGGITSSVPFYATLKGNADTATKLATARTIFGRSFDGTADIGGKILVHGTYTSTASSRFSNGAIEIRENNLVADGQSDIGYAPSIGFHWSNRIAATMLFHNDGNFYLRKQDGVSRASLDANLIGNASTATKLATARSISLGGQLSGSASFNGSANITISAALKHCTVNGSGTANFPYHRIAYGQPGTGAYVDSYAILLISGNYDGGDWGIVKIAHRTNASGDGTNCSARWLIRSDNMSEDAITIASYGTSVTNSVYFDVFFKVDEGWPRMTVTALGPTEDITLVNSSESSSTAATEAWATIAAAGTALHGRAYTKTNTSYQQAIYGAVWN